MADNFCGRCGNNLKTGETKEERVRALLQLMREDRRMTTSQASYKRCKRSLKVIGYSLPEQRTILERMDFDNFVIGDKAFDDIEGVKYE